MNHIEKPSRLKSVWRDMMAAVRGEEYDYTSISLARAILVLSIPMVLEMMMESVFAIVDIFFVSRIGADAVAAVGLTESMMTIFYTMAVGVGAATTAVVARRIGEKDREGAAVAAMQAIIMSVAISLIFMVIGLVFSRQLLLLMGAAPEVAEKGHLYTKWILGSNTVIMLLFVINAIFRSAGDASFAMRVLWLGNILNIILDPLLIFGWGPIPAMGVEGAAIATCIGRGIAVLFQLWLLLRPSERGRIKICRRHFRLDFSVIRNMIRIAVGSVAQHIIATTSWVFLMRIVAVFGSQVLAGYTIALRVVVFSLLPSWGLSNAAATLVGQNLGAGKPERSERSVWITSLINMALLGFIGLFFALFPTFFIRLFTVDPTVVISGSQCLRWVSFGFLAYGPGMVLIQSFNGAGDTATPMKINFFCFWLVETPLAWLLALPAGLSQKGVFIAIAFSETLITIIAFLVFKRGKWKTKKV